MESSGSKPKNIKKSISIYTNEDRNKPQSINDLKKKAQSNVNSVDNSPKNSSDLCEDITNLQITK